MNLLSRQITQGLSRTELVCGAFMSELRCCLVWFDELNLDGFLTFTLPVQVSDIVVVKEIIRISTITIPKVRTLRYFETHLLRPSHFLWNQWITS